MAEDLKTIQTVDLSPFKCMVMTIGELPSSFVESMTYYEALAWLDNYLEKTLIPAVNNNAEAVKELQDLYIELHDYVENYFANLDVQDEINNKLDAMADAGTLQEIIGDYLNATAIWGFDSVAAMKSSTNLINGSFAKTLGYYAKNDGGGATYKIRTVTNDDTIDEMFIIEIGDSANQLVAELVVDNEINIKQLGARPQAQDGTKYDIKNFIDRYISYMDTKGQLIRLYIPSGIWYTSGNLLYGKNGWSIYGDKTFSRFHTYADGTFITSYNNNQDYIFRLGDTSHTCQNWSLENITFSSADFTFSSGTFNYGTIKNITKAIELHHAVFGITDNLFFNSIKGKAFTINSSWGNYFKLLNFYKVSNENSCVMDFEKIDANLEGAAIIGNNFEKIMFEMIHGHAMNFQDDCRVYNNHFGVIRLEPGSYAIEDRVYTNFTNEILASWDDSACVHYALLNLADKCKVGENVFDNIELNNVANRYYTLDGTNYTYDTILYYHNNIVCSNIFTNINDNGMLKNCKVIYLPSTVTTVNGNRSFNTFTNFATPDGKNFMFDVNGLNDINLADNTYLHGDRTTYTFANQSYDYFRLGGWIPAYKSISKRQYTSGKGFIYYDADALNNASLVVTPRTDITDFAFINTVVNTNKKLYLRAKIPNGSTAKVNVTNRTANDNSEETLTGTGAYKVYEISLTNTWNVGDYMRLTLGGASADVRIISIDSYLSV